MINQGGVVKNYTTLNENTGTTSNADQFHKIFVNKLNYSLRKLKTNTSYSPDDIVKILSTKINEYFDKVINKLSSYYSNLIKNIQASIENFDYRTTLDYIQNIEFNLYSSLLGKISKDRSLKIEAVDFNDNDLFNDLSNFFTEIFARVAKKFERAEKELKENNSSIKSIYNNFKLLPPTVENEKNLKEQVIRALPEALNNSINGVISRAEELKIEYTNKQLLTDIVIKGKV